MGRDASPYRRVVLCPWADLLTLSASRPSLGFDKLAARPEPAVAGSTGHGGLTILGDPEAGRPCSTKSS
jgi:hypothetical protein